MAKLRSVAKLVEAVDRHRPSAANALRNLGESVFSCHFASGWGKDRCRKERVKARAENAILREGVERSAQEFETDEYKNRKANRIALRKLVE